VQVPTHLASLCTLPLPDWLCMQGVVQPQEVWAPTTTGERSCTDTITLSHHNPGASAAGTFLYAHVPAVSSLAVLPAAVHPGSSGPVPWSEGDPAAPEEAGHCTWEACAHARQPAFHSQHHRNDT
jgi:hypothetical protein